MLYSLIELFHLDIRVEVKLAKNIITLLNKIVFWKL